MTRISDVMTAPVVTVNRVSRLPVVSKDGTLIGIVSQGDLLSAFACPQ